MKRFLQLKVLVPILLSSCITQTYASDIDASIYVDEQQKLHLMWQAANENIPNTSIQLAGPISKSVETLDSHYRFDGLIAGKYTITLTQGSNTATYYADIRAKRLNRLDAGVTLATLEKKSFDDSSYPEFALSFQALDASGSPVSTLTSEDFTFSENGVDISDYIFRAPSGDEVTKIADVVVVFDDTASMSGEITQLKNNVKLFAEKLVAKGVDTRFRLISYKDDANDGWSWTSDVEVFKSNIGSLRASGGNSIPEDGFEAINIAADYNFRSGAQKVFLFITDASSYEGTDEYGKPTPTKTEINQKLIDNGINLYAIAPSYSQYKGAGSITEASGGKWFPISADFTDVVNEVGNTVGGVYQVAWSALDTDTDTLEIKLKHIDSSKEITHTYARNLAPRVFTFPPKARVVGSDIKIEAKAFDTDNLIDATLKYREHKDDGTIAKWKSIKSTDNLNGKPVFTIPGSDVTAAGLDYLVWFKDEKGAKGFSKIEVLTVGTSVILPSFEVTSHELNSSSDLIFILKFDNLAEADNLKLYFQGSKLGVFIGEAEKEIKEGSDNIGYEKLTNGSYKITLKNAALSTDTGVIGVVKLTAKIGGIVIEGSGKEFDNPARVDLYVKRNADTIILTNFNKMTGDTSGLQTAIQDMVQKTWNLDGAGVPQIGGTDYNMKPVVIDLTDYSILNGVANKFQINSKISSTKLKASSIIASLNKTKSEFYAYSKNKNKMYLLILGGNSIIPYSIYSDYGKYGEGDWFKKNLSSISELVELYYGSKGSIGSYASDYDYREYFKAGRLVDTSLDIENHLKNYIDKKGYVLKSRNATFIGGVDWNELSSGIEVTKSLVENYSKPKAWTTTGSKYYEPFTGLGEKETIKALNEYESGIISFEGHSNYSIVNNSFLFDKFRAGKGVEKLNSLKDKIIVSGMNCHAGVNFFSRKLKNFPTEYAGKGLPVYIANSAYSIYSDTSIFANAAIGYRFMEELLSSSEPNLNIYSQFFVSDSVMDSVSEKSRGFWYDKFARPQFYGIPNYVLGPKPALLRKSAKSKYISSNSKKISNIPTTYSKNKLSITAEKLTINTKIDITDFYRYDMVSGKITILGMDKYDRYHRPVFLFVVNVPDGSEIIKFKINDEVTKAFTYKKSIGGKMCHADGCRSYSLTTSDFNDSARVSYYIKGRKLFVSVIPVQYKTLEKESLITTFLDFDLSVKLPKYVSDIDSDGMPDYWESAYGFDPRDPTGKNGADADPDKDEKTNLQEYAEQTNPLIDNRLKDDITAPEVPTNLVATPQENAVDISFLAPSDAVQVQFFYGVDSSKLIESSRRVMASDGAIDINGLKDETTYYIVARAYDASGNLSDPSSVISFIVPKGVGPNLPQEPVLNDKVLVVKNPTDSDFKGYHLYISDKATMVGATSTSKSANEGTESQIDVSKYFIAGKEFFVTLVAVDTNNHEGKASKAIKLQTGVANTKPIAVDDFFTVKENTTETSDDVLANDIYKVTVTITAFDALSKEGGIVVNNGDGTFTYTPKKDFKGEDSFTYTISDGKGGIAIGTVDIDVTGECFIATAAFGSYLASDVKVLRHFRDNYLLTNELGKDFVEFYYATSPPIADYISKRDSLRAATRWALTPVIYTVKYPAGSLFFILLLIIGWKKRHLLLSKRLTQA